jgi:septum formation protein
MTEKKSKIILASASPRRSSLLDSIDVTYEVMPSQILEKPYKDEQPSDYIIRISRAKAVSIAKGLDCGLVIGADTEVVLNGKVLGKPSGEDDARRMLKMLSGDWHAVMTGIALYDVGSRAEVADYAKTLVRFGHLTDREIDWYIGTGEYAGKAGSYALQGHAALFVEEIAGNYSNVVGLPIPLLYRLARQIGYSLI